MLDTAITDFIGVIISKFLQILTIVNMLAHMARQSIAIVLEVTKAISICTSIIQIVISKHSNLTVTLVGHKIWALEIKTDLEITIRRQVGIIVAITINTGIGDTIRETITMVIIHMEMRTNNTTMDTTKAMVEVDIIRGEVMVTVVEVEEGETMLEIGTEMIIQIMEVPIQIGKMDTEITITTDITTDIKLW